MRGVSCWGANDHGQLAVPDLSALVWSRLVAGRDFSCVSAMNVGLRCWGDVPFTPPNTGHYVRLTAGERHVCGIRSTGFVDCWGENDLGQTLAPAGVVQLVIEAGRNHTCTLIAGSPVCWGDDTAGQSSPPPGLAATWVMAGDGYSCSRNVNGPLQCWGTGAAASPSTLSSVWSLSRWEPAHACGRAQSDELICWGTPSSPAALPPLRNSNLRADACRNNCSAPRCGDGVIDTGETCDDRNTTSGDGCSSSCSSE
jgi:cysteine-rich repeat protein